MMMKKEFWLSFIKKTFLTAANFYLFYPIIQIFVPLNEFESASAFQYFLIATSLVTLLLPFRFVWIPLQLFIIAFTFQQYFPVAERGLQWLQVNYRFSIDSLQFFFEGESTIFPTNIALLLMLLFISLATYLLINRLKPSWAILTSLIYLMILHVFTDYDFFNYVIQILGVSIILLGVTQIPTNKGWRSATTAFLIAGVFGAFLTWFSFWATETFTLQQQWVENQSRNIQIDLDKRGLFDFVDFYRSGEGLQQLGYSENDRELGGPVQQNFEPVFTAYSDTSHYWLISTKTIYNGRGWDFSNDSGLGPIGILTGATIDRENPSEIVIDREEDFGYFPYTYQMTGIQIDDGTFLVELPTLNLAYQSDMADTVAPTSYTLTVANTDIDESLLRNAPFPNEEFLGVEELALPESIPARVWELAAQITEGHETLYDQVLAIENYLRSEAGLRYSMREAAYVPEGEDYVDHFLFESLVGYCDNFSTAMVILARMNGIPARWAKGFNGGTQQTDEDGNTYYEISNANAHSWPEIYFPDLGWIPFEPTPAFQQTITDFVTATDENEEETPIADDEAILTPEEDDAIIAEEESAVIPETRPDTDASHVKESSESDWLPQVGWTLFIVGAIAAILTRKKWYTAIIQFLIEKTSLSVLAKTKLILSLFRIGYKKRKNETLRQYFEEVSKLVPMHKENIQFFIQLNEELLYAPTDETVSTNIKETNIAASMIPVFKDLQTIKKKSSF